MHDRLANDSAHRTQFARTIVYCRCAKSQVGHRCESDSYERRMDVLGCRDRSVFTTHCWTRHEREQRHQSCLTSTQQCEVCSWSKRWSKRSLHRSTLRTSHATGQCAKRVIAGTTQSPRVFAAHSNGNCSAGTDSQRRVRHDASSVNKSTSSSTQSRGIQPTDFSPIEFELRWQSCQLTVESMCP